MDSKTWIDKTEWGDGPWLEEPDRTDWVDPASGYPCITRRHPSGGQWCGYVGVAPEHPLYGKSYNDVGDDIYVHGGLTFGEACDDDDSLPPEERICHVPEPGESGDVWWFGFDCAHAGDLRPGHAKFEREVRERAGIEMHLPGDTYRTLEYVQEQCRELAEQLVEAAGKGQE